MVTTTQQQLRCEIGRIVQAPYTVSLKNFHEIVLCASDKELLDWAKCKPCQIERLASVVIEGLSLWPYVLQILERLSIVPSFRDALLQVQPLLLDELLKRALASTNSINAYSSICINLLSNPLPPSTPLPARTPQFFLQCIHTMIQSPCAGTVRPLYQMFSSIETNVLEILPNETMESFQVEITNILRKTDDHIASLLCLAVFAKIVSWASASSSSNEAAQDDRPSWLQSMRHFFDSKRGVKTIDVVALRVILACSENTPLSQQDSEEILLLAWQIVALVEPSQRTAWVEANRAKAARLEAKIAREGLRGDLRMLASAFLVQLFGFGNMPPTILGLVQKSVVNTTEASFAQLPEDVTVFLLSGLLTHGDPGLGANILSFLVDQVSSERQVDSHRNLHLATTYLESLSVDSKSVERVRQNLTMRLFSNEGAALRQSLLSSSPKSTPKCHVSDHDCAWEVHDLQVRLYVDLCRFILLNAYGCPLSREAIDGFLQPLTSKMITIHATTSGSKADRASCIPSTSTTQLSLFEQSSTPSTSSTNADWRTSLADDLLREASQTRTSIIRRVGEVCRDLEARCESIEEPLTHARKQLKLKEDALIFANDRVMELEQQLGEQEQAVLDLSRQIHEINRVGGDNDHRLATVSESLAAKEAELRAVKVEVEGLRETVARGKETESKLLSALVPKDKLIEETRIQVEELKKARIEDRTALETKFKESLAERDAKIKKHMNDFEEKERESEDNKQGWIVCQRQQEAMNMEIHCLNDGIAKKDALLVENESTIGDLKRQISDLGNDIKEFGTRMDESHAQVEDLNRQLAGAHDEHQEAIKQHDEALIALRQEHQNDRNELVLKIKIRETRYRGELAAVQSTLAGVERQTKVDLKAKAARIFTLESKLQNLSEERAKMMAVMGVQVNSDLSGSSSSQSATQGVGNVKKSKAAVSKSSTGTTRRRSEAGAHQSFGSTASSLDVPSPKRLRRPIVANKTPSKRVSMGPPRSVRLNTSQEFPSEEQTGRVAMRGLSPNRSPQKSQLQSTQSGRERSKTEDHFKSQHPRKTGTKASSSGGTSALRESQVPPSSQLFSAGDEEEIEEVSCDEGPEYFGTQPSFVDTQDGATSHMVDLDLEAFTNELDEMSVEEL